MRKQIQPIDIVNKKHKAEKITMLTAYDVITATLISQAEIDMILVGDSAGNVVSGYDNTIPVTVDQIVYHSQAVKRGNQGSLIVGDMPFLSYQVSLEQAKANAGRLIKEGGAQAIKVEMVSDNVDVVKAILDMGIPVMAHLGFTPQSVYQLGGYKVQGREDKAKEKMLSLAKSLDEIGCFAIILEMVPGELAKQMTAEITIPTIGIGAGPDCDGQVLVTNDLLGFNTGFSPKFSKQYVNMSEQISTAVADFKKDVEGGAFPDESHTFQ